MTTLLDLLTVNSPGGFYGRGSTFPSLGSNGEDTTVERVKMIGKLQATVVCSFEGRPLEWPMRLPSDVDTEALARMLQECEGRPIRVLGAIELPIRQE